jgi:hypothetical protein
MTIGVGGMLIEPPAAPSAAISINAVSLCLCEDEEVSD